MAPPPPKRVRSYDAWLSRLRTAAARWSDLRVGILGQVSSARVPLPYLFSSFGDASAGGSARVVPGVVLTAGAHGDEPAGVEALTVLLERRSEWMERLHGYRLTIFPCINPSGYEHGTRANHDGIDLNREFDRDDCPREVALVRQALGNSDGYLASFEFHEDVDTDGFYLYELAAAPPYLGETIIRGVEPTAVINHRPEIEGFAASKGVIRPDPDGLAAARPDHWPQAIYTFRHGTPRCFTFETPTQNLSLSARAEIHLTALRAALAGLAENRE